MTNRTEIAASASLALARAMERAGCTATLVLAPATKQADWRDYSGIAVFGDDSEAVTRAAKWLKLWAERNVECRDADGNATKPWRVVTSKPDFCGRVDFVADLPLADRRELPKVRALVVTHSHKIAA